MVRTAGSKVWRRVWSVCYSNAASFFVGIKGERLFIHTSDLDIEIIKSRADFEAAERSQA